MAEDRVKNLAKNKIFGHILMELTVFFLVTAGVYGYGYFHSMSEVLLMRNTVMTALGVGITGFLYRQDYLAGRLYYDNGAHYGRFWAVFGAGTGLAFICVFLPEQGWPFLPLYVLLTLFSDTVVGVLAASLLLMVSTLLSGVSMEVFSLYFVSGIFGAALFGNLKKGFSVGIPVFLSMLCLLVCETAGTVLVSNEHLSAEAFLLPGANIVVSSVLLLVILKLFSSRVVYKYRERYLELNDPENAILAEYKEQDRSAYFECVHTAYFCERIADRLKMDADALKCAGYYHKMADFQEFTEKYDFPPKVREILREYHTGRRLVTRRETAVLLCANTVVNSILFVRSRGEERKVDYGQVIDTVFKKFQKAGTFQECDITMRELMTIEKIFKEEKLYYDFLC